MQKVWKIILVISIIANIILVFILSVDPKTIETNLDVYTEKIDSLESEILNLRQTKDSIRSLIDTVFVEIRNNEEYYEKIRDTILSNSVSEDYLFFTEYLNQYRERHDSINNF